MHTIAAMSRGVLGMSAGRVARLVTGMSELVALGTRSLPARPPVGSTAFPARRSPPPSWFSFLYTLTLAPSQMLPNRWSGVGLRNLKVGT